MTTNATTRHAESAAGRKSQCRPHKSGCHRYSESHWHCIAEDKRAGGIGLRGNDVLYARATCIESHKQRASWFAMRLVQCHSVGASTGARRESSSSEHQQLQRVVVLPMQSRWLRELPSSRETESRCMRSPPRLPHAQTELCFADMIMSRCRLAVAQSGSRGGWVALGLLFSSECKEKTRLTFR